MKHMNEQIDAMAKSIDDASRMKGIQWNRVTWYSWWLAIILFLIVIPLLSFYVGIEYQKTIDTALNAKEILQVAKPPLSSIPSQDATGMHCGGFIKDAPVCPAGYHCKLKPMADLGGSCVRD